MTQGTLYTSLAGCLLSDGVPKIERLEHRDGLRKVYHQVFEFTAQVQRGLDQAIINIEMLQRAWKHLPKRYFRVVGPFPDKWQQVTPPYMDSLEIRKSGQPSEEDRRWVFGILISQVAQES